MSATETPYISVVVTAGHGGFVESWTSHAARLGLSSEVLAAAPECRNAAIRRAKGEFILCTESDAVFSEELMRFLASRQLRKGRLYRTDCYQGNRIHAREGSFQLSAEGLRENQAEDIAGVGSGIHFGEGWFAAERDPESGEIFRWMENDAEVALRIPAGGGALTLEVEPGPGVGPLPQVLQAMDGSGAKVAEWSIGGRATLRLWAPPTARGFRLRAADGGRALLNDLRILNFRYFHCDWTPAKAQGVAKSGLSSMRPTLTRLAVSYARHRAIAAFPVDLRRAIRLLGGWDGDIFGAGIVYCGLGWHRLEEAGSVKFRWVSTNAELVVKAEGGQQDLCLLVEPGPSLEGRPFRLQIRLAGGAAIGETEVRGLTLVRVPLPLAEGEVAALLLSPDVEGEVLPPLDSRVLNFRVLACACERSGRATAPAAIEGWAAVTVSEKASGIDWEAKLREDRVPLSEIGKPAFLHVNCCDFVLMDRDLWHEVRGYPEADESQEYLNALLCYSAHFGGATEEVLRGPLRIERPAGTERVPAALDGDMVWLITQMRRLHAPAILNREAWGLDA